MSTKKTKSAVGSLITLILAPVAAVFVIIAVVVATCFYCKRSWTKAVEAVMDSLR